MKRNSGEIEFEEKEGEIEPDDLNESWGKFWHDTAWWLNFLFVNDDYIIAVYGLKFFKGYSWTDKDETDFKPTD